MKVQKLVEKELKPLIDRGVLKNPKLKEQANQWLSCMEKGDYGLYLKGTGVVQDISSQVMMWRQ